MRSANTKESLTTSQLRNRHVINDNDNIPSNFNTYFYHIYVKIK
jgi:hypothetical protein